MSTLKVNKLQHLSATNKGIVVDDNYTLPYGGPIVDGKVTDLEGLVQVKHYETTMNIGWMNTIIEASQIIECNNC